MSIYKQREIVLVPFPFSDLSGKKVRPVLVLSNDSYNKMSSDILVCGLTTNLKKTPYSIVVSPEEVETKSSLRHKSKIKVDAIASIEKELLLKTIAKLKLEIFEKVINEVNRLIKVKNKKRSKT